MGYRAYAAYKGALAAAGCAQEFREQVPNTRRRMASRKTVRAASEASVPPDLKEAIGEDFLRRSTWSVANEAGPSDAPFLLSRSQMANLPWYVTWARTASL